VRQWGAAVEIIGCVCHGPGTSEHSCISHCGNRLHARAPTPSRPGPSLKAMAADLTVGPGDIPRGRADVSDFVKASRGGRPRAVCARSLLGHHFEGRRLPLTSVIKGC
jgi:hypothetical protein